LPRLAAPAPVLTAYLDTNPATPPNQGSPPGYLAWLKARARLLDARVPESERALFREHVGRLERHLYSHPPRQRAVVAFSGAGTREFLPLQVEVEDELHWGPAALKQLFWLLDKHQPSGAVVPSRSGARLLRAWLGEVAEEEPGNLLRRPVCLAEKGFGQAVARGRAETARRAAGPVRGTDEGPIRPFRRPAGLFCWPARRASCPSTRGLTVVEVAERRGRYGVQ
jgi:hypothetical protein